MLSYRPDIDGLRAIAVLAVILFHAGIPFVPGGYVGVDVFFVISGYLISSILLKEQTQGRFSIATFYERRIRRIFPPLFAMLAVVALASVFILLPSELRGFGKTLLATTLFYSNFELWSDSSYFAPAADTKPLLHTWSLCVEEQFYFVFPLLLWGLMRMRRSFVVVCIAALVAGSFAWSVVEVDRDPTTAFYLPHTRAWELLIGTLLALGVVPTLKLAWLRNLFAFSGALALSYAVVFYQKSTPFPGLGALLPCVGTALLIHAGAGGQSMITRLLSHRLMVRIGLISYALYLWHWPLLVLAQHAAIRALRPWEIAALLMLTVLLSIASYFFVEQPVRLKQVLVTRSQVFRAGFALIALGAALGLVTDRLKGFPSRLPKRARALEREGKGTTQRVARRYCNSDITGQIGYTHCEAGAPGQKARFILWGDSHAAATAPGMVAAARKLGVAGVVASRTACAPLLGVRNRGGAYVTCETFNASIRELVASSEIEHAVLIARWGLLAHGIRFKHERGGERWLTEEGAEKATPPQNSELLRKGLTNTVEFLTAHQKRVTIVASVPEVGFHVTGSLARLLWWGRALDIRPTLKETLDRQRSANDIFTSLQRTHGVNVVYPHEILCGDKRCAVQGEGKPYYRDEDHLTEHGALKLAPMFEGVLKPSES